jgi:hypothetical protein
LKVHFEVGTELVLTCQDGSRIIDYVKLAEQRESERKRAADLQDRLRKAEEQLRSLGIDPKGLE